MTKVLIATDKPFAPQAVDGMKQAAEEAGYEIVLLEKYGDPAKWMAAAADADAMVVRSDQATREIFDAAKNLKIIVRAGAGFDNIDLQAATDHKVVVENTPGQNSNAVAELTLGMMVYLARNGFNGKSGIELMGKKLGLHAYGNVGRNVARVARGFGMEIYAFDPYISKEAIEKDGTHAVESVEELYSICNYVSLHIPATAETRGSINFSLLSRMPQHAVLVNTARKEVVDEQDLLRMFAERSDFYYIADVAPDCQAQIAEQYPGRFFFTPKKMGAQTEEANTNAGIAAIKQIQAFFEKGDTRFQVNK